MDLNEPEKFLDDLISSDTEQRIWVVTGNRGVGKTSWCKRIINQSRIANFVVSGILSPARFEDGVRTGMHAECLKSDEHRLLASLKPGEINGRRYGPWIFDPSVFAWGNMYLSSLKSQRLDLLVIDELGFLEFDLHEGWISGFDLLSKGIFRAALVVIRPECINAFSKMGFRFTTWEVPNLMINI